MATLGFHSTDLPECITTYGLPSDPFVWRKQTFERITVEGEPVLLVRERVMVRSLMERIVLRIVLGE